MLWSHRRASRIHWIELKTNQEGKENTGRIITFHYMFKNRKAKPWANVVPIVENVSGAASW